MNRRTSQAVAARLTWIRLRVTHFMARSWAERLRRGGQVVELDDRVGLGPAPELARVGEGLVVSVDDLLAVEEDLKVIALCVDRELVPLAGRDLAVPPGKLPPVSLDHVIEPDVVLESICSDHVVVVVVLQPEDQAAALVFLPGDRFALHRELEVLHLWPGVGDGKTVVGPIGVCLDKDVLAARRVLDGLDHPLPRRALPGPPERESLWRFPWLVRLKIEPCCRTL